MPTAEIIAVLSPTPSGALQGRPAMAQDVAGGFAEALLQASGPGRLRRPTEAAGAEALAAAAAGAGAGAAAAAPSTPQPSSPVAVDAGVAVRPAPATAPAPGPGFLAAPPPVDPAQPSTQAAAAPVAGRLAAPSPRLTGGETATVDAEAPAIAAAPEGEGPITPGGSPATAPEKATPTPAVAPPAAPAVSATPAAAAAPSVQPETLGLLGQRRQAIAALALGATARLETSRPAPPAEAPLAAPFAPDAAAEGEGNEPILPPLSLARAAGERAKSGPAAGSTTAAATPSAAAGAQAAATGAAPAQPSPPAAAPADAAVPASDPAPAPPAAPGAASAPSPAAPASPAAAASQAAAHAPVEAVAQIAAQIVRRLEGRATRFDMQLNPAELGRVDVRLEIDAEGRLAARLAFDNPAVAADLRARVDELRRGLEDAGFQLADDAFSFADREQQERRQPQAWTHRAFAEGAETAARADLDAAPVVRLAAATGLDVRI